MKKTLKIIGIVVLVLMLIPFLAGLFGIGDEATETTTDIKEVQSKPVEVEKTTELEDEQNWYYSEEKDEMDGSIRYFASVVSSNEVEFEFPYNGGSSLHLFIRNMKGNTDIAIKISKGQFIGTILGDEYLRIKFDDEAPVKYYFNGANNGSSEYIFPSKSKTLIKKLKKAKKVMIEAPFYDTNRTVFYFNVEGLEWNK